ncbi:MAG: HAD hydrolase-like protein [Clostridia bacterium]|nr:HAD hydrolase-like protein [Clostridia bacterium]
MSKLNPKLILFDFDGTVADTGRGIFNCVGYAASAFGWALPDEEALRSFVGPPLHDSFRRVFGVSEEQALSAVEKYRELYWAVIHKTVLVFTESQSCITSSDLLDIHKVCFHKSSLFCGSFFA